MKPEIKPCLYCGGPMIVLPERIKLVTYVECTSTGCLSDGPARRTEAEAIAAHNAAWERLQGMEK